MPSDDSAGAEEGCIRKWSLVVVRLSIATNCCLIPLECALSTLLQVLLVVLFCRPPLSCRYDLRDDCLPESRRLSCDTRLSQLLLGIRVIEEGGTILRTDVATLTILSSRIMLCRGERGERDASANQRERCISRSQRAGSCSACVPVLTVPENVQQSLI